jgi:hypothetical protein
VKKNPIRKKSHTQGGVCVLCRVGGFRLRLVHLWGVGGGGGLFVGCVGVLWCVVVFGCGLCVGVCMARWWGGLGGSVSSCAVAGFVCW